MLPQAPQFAASVESGVSHPVEASVSQSPQPAEQVPSWQVPWLHTGEALGNSHEIAQLPQKLAS